MGILTALAGIAALGTAAQYHEARKQRKSQEREMERNETKAREAAKADYVKDDPNATVVVGTQDDTRRRRAQRSSASGAASSDLMPSSIGTKLL